MRVIDVRRSFRLGNAALTVVTPEPGILPVKHSPPESTGGTSGTNAANAAAPPCGENDSLAVIRMRTSESLGFACTLARDVSAADGVGGEAFGLAFVEHAATPSTPPANSAIVPFPLPFPFVMACSGCAPASTRRGRPAPWATQQR